MGVPNQNKQYITQAVVKFLFLWSTSSDKANWGAEVHKKDKVEKGITTSLEICIVKTFLWWQCVIKNKNETIFKPMSTL